MIHVQYNHRYTSASDAFRSFTDASHGTDGIDDIRFHRCQAMPAVAAMPLKLIYSLIIHNPYNKAIKQTLPHIYQNKHFHDHIFITRTLILILPR